MNNNFDSKDLRRVRDIVSKAAGGSTSMNERNKELQLTEQMARSIKDVQKALRRANAATAIGRHDLAAIFFVRYGELKN